MGRALNLAKDSDIIRGGYFAEALSEEFTGLDTMLCSEDRS
jgi:hypothetical protein